MTTEWAHIRHYLENPQHWCPRSQAYAGVDNLVSALDKGWKINRHVYRHAIWRGGSRPVVIYYFELRNGNKITTMPVISNPYLLKVIANDSLEIIDATQRQSVHA